MLASVQQVTATTRRGRPPLPERETLIAILAQPNRRAWRPGEIALAAGVHRNTVLSDIDTGRLVTYRIPCGQSWENVAAHADVVDYVRGRGVVIP